ncbi:MAG: GTPase Era [Tissierellia bacterium]|nr:GTPase Era [Tissierellia bacterium]
MVKSGFCAVVGRANVGKSTLVNQLVGEKVSIVSSKSQTTRHAIKGIVTQEKGQIIFVDTPGMHKPKNKLDDYMLERIDESLVDMDLILFMVDISQGVGPGDLFMSKKLPSNVPKLLLLNKIDLIDEKGLLENKKAIEELGEFNEVIALSAIIPETVLGLLDKIYDYLPEGPMYYPEDSLTDMSDETLIEEIIREKALHYLDQEVPHGIAVVLEEYTQEENGLYMAATIIVERDSHKGIVIGKGGRKLKGIGRAARLELVELFKQPVHLELWVKVKSDWRRSSHYIKEYGYDK